MRVADLLQTASDLQTQVEQTQKETNDLCHRISTLKTQIIRQEIESLKHVGTTEMISSIASEGVSEDLLRSIFEDKGTVVAELSDENDQLREELEAFKESLHLIASERADSLQRIQQQHEEEIGRLRHALEDEQDTNEQHLRQITQLQEQNAQMIHTMTLAAAAGGEGCEKF
eukprot:gnl/Trimastix_PCT/3937.p1 GENE.gnl/Trimastix_PCT/3937~~gnl/Trimastix_PCT/3937.p1  ORF type:complete len:191 (-),score=15.68 gnl/Trimastix_PCT/3937:41-556(-)